MNSQTWAVAGLFVAIVALLACVEPASAQEQPARLITGVEPAVLSQGETVLLTITGENLPTGTVVVEFFPQHIALLDVLAANDSEVLAQVKVPNLAPPGSYNVLVYNHLGEEAFAEGLLSISGTVITPVFRDYSPKEIGEASQGFALLLTGDAISDGAIPFLSMRWNHAGQEFPRLETTFSKGAPGQIVCAVTGDVPVGVLQGRIYLNDIPIYLVEVTVKGAAGLVVGHRPMSLDVASDEYSVELLGTNLEQGFLRALEIELSTPQITARPASVSLIDVATVRVTFSGPLPPGIYQLSARYRGELVYGGEVELVAAESVQPQDSEAADSITAAISGDAEPAVDASSPAAGDVSAGEAGEGPDAVPQAPTASLRDPTAGTGAAGSVIISSVAPLAIAAGERPASFAITGEGLSAAVVARLELDLSVDGLECPLLFLGAGEGSFTCLFAPPEQAWFDGTTAALTVTDPLGTLDSYSAELVIEGAAPQLGPAPLTPSPARAEPPATIQSEDWGLANVYVKSGAVGGTLTVVLNASSGSWDPALIRGSFVLLPTQSVVSRAFSNTTLTGELAFRRSESGAPVGSFAGNFISGDLLVQVNYADGGPIVSTWGLDSPLPQAEFIGPGIEYLRLESPEGILQPDSLRWVVEFAPLVVADPSFLVLGFAPGSESPYQVERSAEGTQVVFTQELTAWEDIEDWGEDLTCTVNSSIELDWQGSTVLSLPVKKAQVEFTGLSFEIRENECVIDDTGIEIVLVPSDELPPLARLGEVTLTTSHILLSRNADKFTAQAVSTSADGQPAVLLMLRRNREAISDVAYDLLAADLVESASVDMSLTWEELGISLNEDVSFIRRETKTGDILEELSLRQAAPGE